MANCTKCGAELNEESYFCPSCGTPVGSAVADAVRVEDDEPIDNGIAPGFSARVDTDEFREAVSKGNKTFVIAILATMLLLPPIVTFIAGLLTHKETHILVAAGVIVEFIMIIICIFVIIQRFTTKSWDGVVERKYMTRERAGRTARARKVGVIECMTDEGKKKKYKDRVIGQPMYHYLEEDDRVRFHPQLTYPFEKYDKSHDERIFCHFCGSMSPIEADYCTSCKKPLLK